MTATQKRARYPSQMTGVYTSTILSILSIVLAILLFNEKPWLFAYYFIVTIFVAATVFAVKHHILSNRATKLANNNSLKNAEEEPERGPRRRLLILTFVGLISILITPLLLTRVLDPASWFILLISYTTGVSGAEILLYLYTR